MRESAKALSSCVMEMLVLVLAFVLGVGIVEEVDVDVVPSPLSPPLVEDPPWSKAWTRTCSINTCKSCSGVSSPTSTLSLHNIK